MSFNGSYQFLKSVVCKDRIWLRYLQWAGWAINNCSIYLGFVSQNYVRWFSWLYILELKRWNKIKKMQFCEFKHEYLWFQKIESSNIISAFFQCFISIMPLLCQH
jgi:hypothetical protein